MKPPFTIYNDGCDIADADGALCTADNPQLAKEILAVLQQAWAQKPAGHTYPSNYKPGTHWAVTEAWEILDRLPPGQLTDDQRFLIAGMIIGTMMRVAADRQTR